MKLNFFEKGDIVQVQSHEGRTLAGRVHPWQEATIEKKMAALVNPMCPDCHRPLDSGQVAHRCLKDVTKISVQNDYDQSVEQCVFSKVSPSLPIVI